MASNQDWVEAQEAGRLEYPGDFCCSIFDHYHFEGYTRRYCYDELVHGPEAKIQIDYLNNRVSSWYCGDKI